MPRKRQIFVDRDLRRWMLQFGRGCYAAETRDRDKESSAIEALQFGRGCYAAETPRARPAPRSSALGFNSAAAVMPRKPVNGRRSTQSLSGFNSAAAVMPRKHCSWVPFQSGPASFNSAAAVMPRKQGVSQDIGVQRIGFNSAAAVMPRKLLATMNVGKTDIASIRPRLLCRGNFLAPRACGL